MDMDVDKESCSAADTEEQPMFDKCSDEADHSLDAEVVAPPPAGPLTTESCRTPYNPHSALVMAILDWLPELYKTKTSCGAVRPHRIVDGGGGGCGGQPPADVKLGGDELGSAAAKPAEECDRSPMQSAESMIPGWSCRLTALNALIIDSKDKGKGITVNIAPQAAAAVAAALYVTDKGRRAACRLSPHTRASSLTAKQPNA